MAFLDTIKDPDVANAVTTGALTGLAHLIPNYASSSLFKYYEQQEKLYIQAAQENARRLRIKGDLALRKLKVENAILQGRNELSAAAGGGRLSGSTLDVLSTNYRYNAIDERTQQLETLWSVTEAKRAGYNNALDIAGKAMQTAVGQKANVLRAITAMGASISTDLAKDREQDIKNKYIADTIQNALNQRQGTLENLYGTDSLFLNPDIASSMTGINNERNRIQSLINIDTDDTNSLLINQ